MKIFAYFLILGLCFSLAKAATVSEAGIPDTCKACQNQMQSPLAKQPIRPVASHITKNQCEIEISAGAVPMGIDWSVLDCEDFPDGSKEKIFLDACAIPERPEDIGKELLSILASNFFEREFQLVMRGSPLVKDDNDIFEKTVEKWRSRMDLVADPEIKEKLAEALESKLQFWKQQRESDSQLEGDNKLDMGAARAAIAYSVIQNIRSENYTKGLKNVSPSEAKLMQLEELDLLSFEYPEFVLPNPRRSVRELSEDAKKSVGNFIDSAYDGVSRIIESEELDSFSIISPKLTSPSIQRLALEGKINLDKGADAEQLQTQKKCDSIAMLTRMERLNCRVEAASPAILNALDKLQDLKLPISAIRAEFARKTKDLYDQMDAEWAKAVKTPGTLVDQSELLAQLTAMRTLKQDRLGTLKAFVRRCEAEQKMAASQAYYDKLETATAGSMLVLGTVATLSRGVAVFGGSRVARNSKAIEKLLLAGDKTKISSRQVQLLKNSPKILDRSVRAEKISATAGTAMIPVFAGHTLHQFVTSQGAYKRELINYMISNSRSPESVSENFVRLQNAMKEKSEFKWNTAVMVASMLPLSFATKYENLAAEASSPSVAAQLRQTADRFRKTDLAVDIGWASASLAQGNIAGATLQLGLRRLHFGKSPSEIEVERRFLRQSPQKIVNMRANRTGTFEAVGDIQEGHQYIVFPVFRYRETQ